VDGSGWYWMRIKSFEKQHQTNIVQTDDVCHSLCSVWHCNKHLDCSRCVWMMCSTTYTGTLVVLESLVN